MSSTNPVNKSKMIRSQESENDLTRRSALGRIAIGGTAGALAATGVANGATIPGGIGASSGMLRMGAQQWEQFVGQQFTISDDQHGSRAGMRLVEVIDESRSRKQDPHRPANLRCNPVSLLFSTDEEVECATMAVNHPKLGHSRMFFNRTVRDAHPNRKIYAVILN